MQNNYHEYFQQSPLMTGLPETANATATATRLNKQVTANQKAFVQIGDTVYGKLSKYFRKPGVIVDTENEDKNLVYTIRWEGGAISTCKRRGFWNEYELHHHSANESRLPFDVPTLLQNSTQMQDQQHFLQPSQHYPEHQQHQRQLLHHPVASVVTTAQRISQSNSFGLSNNTNNPLQQPPLFLNGGATLHPTTSDYVNMIDHHTSSSHSYINYPQAIDSVTLDEQGHKQKQRRLDTQSLSPSDTFQPTTTSVSANNNPRSSPPSTGDSHSRNNSNSNTQKKRASMPVSMHTPRERSSSTPLAENNAFYVPPPIADTNTHTVNMNSMNSNFDTAITNTNQMNNNNTETNNNTNSDINQLYNINLSNGLLLNTTVPAVVAPSDPLVNTAVLSSVDHNYPFHHAFAMPMASSETAIEQQKAQALKELHRLQQEMQEKHKLAVIASSTTINEDNTNNITDNYSNDSSDNDDSSSNSMRQAAGAMFHNMDTTAAAVLSSLSANNGTTATTNINTNNYSNFSKPVNNPSDIIKALALASQQQQLQYRPPALDTSTDNTNNNNINNSNIDNNNNNNGSFSDGENNTDVVHSVSKDVSSDNENGPMVAPLTGLISSTHGNVLELKDEIAPYHILLPINKISEDVRGGRRSHKQRFISEENDSQNPPTNTNNKAAKICRYICKICKAFKASHYCARCSRFRDKEKFILAICEPATGRDCLIQHLRKLGVPEGYN